MTNAFKLWLSKNSSKIFAGILLILFVYLFLKGIDTHYADKNKKRDDALAEREKRIIANSARVDGKSTTSDSKNEINDNYVIELNKIKKNTEEHNDVYNILIKLLNLAYDANQSDNNLTAKKDMYDVFSDDLIKQLSNNEKKVSVENVTEYFFDIESLEDFSASNLYEYSKYNNVSRYAYVIRYQKEGYVPYYGFVLISVDYNNRTFCYDGLIEDIDEVDKDKKIEMIENKGSNIF